MTEPRHAPAHVVYRWDLDKTYLHTDFSSMRGLLQAAVESAHRKRAIPGMRSLLRTLSQDAQQDGRGARVVVVSGSPTLLERRIRTVFDLHGIVVDRLVLKDFGAAVQRGRLRTLKAQVPYKLRAHLETRLWLMAQKDAAPEVCFGDDAEVDALIYCLYADVCAGRIQAPRLARILEAGGAYPDEVASILGRLPMLDGTDPVRRIFIHLEGNSPPSRYGAYRGRVTATFGALQMALSLAEDHLASDRVLLAVAEELVVDHKQDADALAGTIEDAVRRQLCSVRLATHLVVDLLPKSAAYNAGFDPAFAARVVRRFGPERPMPAAGKPETLPYETLLQEEHAFAQARKLALRTAQRIPGLAEFLEQDDDD